MRPTRPIAAICFALLLLAGGCAQRRAQSAFKDAIELEETEGLPAAREALHQLINRWPKTKAAERARAEIEWIDDILSAAARGPLLAAWDSIRKVSVAVEKFRVRERRFPEQLEELIPRYLAGQVLDPWGVPVRFDRRGDGYVVVSYGADGLPGGTGNNTDFVIQNGRFKYGGRS